MTVGDCLRAALRSLRVNIMRSVLTSLGIIIGVASVITMVAIGAGAESKVQDVIQNLGANIIVIMNGTRTTSAARTGMNTGMSLTEEDAKALQAEIPSIQAAAPTVRGAAQLIFGSNNWSTGVVGITPEYLEVREWPIAEGRQFSDQELKSGAKVALIGRTTAKKLFEDDNPIGQTIRIQRVPFEIVGIMSTKGQTMFGTDEDDTVLVPLATAKMRVLGGRKVRSSSVATIVVKARSAEQLDETVTAATELLRQRHKLRQGQDDDFMIRNISQMVEAQAESVRVMTILLASVAGVSLIVGGIGIMNIMLVSVTERTREIGLRMAMGARGRDIRTQFVIEAIVLALIGGAIGIAIGIGLSIAVSQMADWPTLLKPEAILLAAGFAAAVGVFFGFYPAHKASRLDPIEALRHE